MMAVTQKKASVMQVIQLDHWSSFVEKTHALNGWAFRGEVSAHWPLYTSLARRLQSYCPDRNLWPLRESRALRIFRRKAHNYLTNNAALDDDLRSLALMQHHGAPTRLLDFTKSPYVAAFFAMNDAVDECAVYALNTPRLWAASPTFDLSLTREHIDPRIEGHYQQYFLPNKYPIVWFGEPLEMDRRLVAQSGLFVVPGVLDVPLEKVLESYGSEDEDLLIKYVLMPAMRAAGMEALYRMNVTSASLFPDLEGLARASAYELELIWDRLVADYQRSG